MTSSVVSHRDSRHGRDAFAAAPSSRRCPPQRSRPSSSQAPAVPTTRSRGAPVATACIGAGHTPSGLRRWCGGPPGKRRSRAVDLNRMLGDAELCDAARIGKDIETHNPAVSDLECHQGDDAVANHHGDPGSAVNEHRDGMRRERLAMTAFSAICRAPRNCSSRSSAPTGCRSATSAPKPLQRRPSLLQVCRSASCAWLKYATSFEAPSGHGKTADRSRTPPRWLRFEPVGADEVAEALTRLAGAGACGARAGSGGSGFLAPWDAFTARATILRDRTRSAEV
jgi:hypothetical protein